MPEISSSESGGVGVRPRIESNSGHNGAAGRSRSNEEMNDAPNHVGSTRNTSSESAAWVREHRDNVDLLDPKEFDDEFFGLNPLVQGQFASPSFPGASGGPSNATPGAANTNSADDTPSTLLPKLPQPSRKQLRLQHLGLRLAPKPRPTLIYLQNPMTTSFGGCQQIVWHGACRRIPSFEI